MQLVFLVCLVQGKIRKYNCCTQLTSIWCHQSFKFTTENTGIYAKVLVRFFLTTDFLYLCKRNNRVWWVNLKHVRNFPLNDLTRPSIVSVFNRWHNQWKFGTGGIFSQDLGIHSRQKWRSTIDFTPLFIIKFPKTLGFNVHTFYIILLTFRKHGKRPWHF